MKDYNPNKAIDPQQWLALDEYWRINMIKEYHQQCDDDLEEDARNAHSAMHCVVENQIAEKVAHVPETLAKLTRQGLDRHEAIHAIAAIIAEDIYELMNGEQKTFDSKKYRRKLDKLTAKRWRKGQY